MGRDHHIHRIVKPGGCRLLPTHDPGHDLLSALTFRPRVHKVSNVHDQPSNTERNTPPNFNSTRLPNFALDVKFAGIGYFDVVSF